MGAIVAAFLDDPTLYPAGKMYSPPVATDPGTLQSAIVARLVAQQANYAALAGIEIDGFPDDPESWRAINQIGTVLVRFEGSTYGGIEDTGEVVHQRKVKFRIGILARGLGWSDAAGVSAQGAYPILDSVRSILMGFKITGCDKIYCDRDEFVRRDKQGGIWIYALDVTVPTWVVENPDPETIPNLVEAIANITDGASSESVNTTEEP